MKIIFLDIDGVLNYFGCKDKIGNMYFVNDEKIKILKEIIENTNAKIVLSSTWRYGWFDLDKNEESKDRNDFIKLRDKLLEFGIELYDKTPIYGMYRGEEIEKWLSDKNNIDNILIIDDNVSDMYPYGRFVLQTSNATGLKRNQIKKCVSMLSGNKYKDFKKEKEKKNKKIIDDMEIF